MRGAAFLATLCVLLMVPSNGMGKKRRKKNNDSIYERKRTCQTDTCGHLVPLEAGNCVNDCVSPDCYKKTFKEPLEDGEVNTQLSKNFMSCARRETKSTAFTQKRYHQQSRQQQQETSDKQNAATSGSKPGVVASEASVVLPKGVPGNNKAAKLFPRDLERDLEQNIEQNLEQNLEQDLEQDFLLSGGVLDSEEDEDGDFDEEYDDTFYGDEGDSQ